MTHETTEDGIISESYSHFIVVVRPPTAKTESEMGAELERIAAAVL